MTSQPRSILLDTHAAIWWMEGTLSAQAASSLTVAGLADGVFVSPISAWEIGLLAKPRANREAADFMPDPKTWFDNLMSKPTVKHAPFTHAIALAVSTLTEPLHSDPADRFLVATARAMNVPLMTRDGKIAEYARLGHLEIIAC